MAPRATKKQTSISLDPAQRKQLERVQDKLREQPGNDASFADAVRVTLAHGFPQILGDTEPPPSGRAA